MVAGGAPAPPTGTPVTVPPSLHPSPPQGLLAGTAGGLSQGLWRASGKTCCSCNSCLIWLSIHQPEKSFPGETVFPWRYFPGSINHLKSREKGPLFGRWREVTLLLKWLWHLKRSQIILNISNNFNNYNNIYWDQNAFDFMDQRWPINIELYNLAVPLSKIHSHLNRLAKHC